MPQIIQRPNYLADAITANVNAAQIQRQREEFERAQERERQKNLAITAAAAVATLGVGLIAAPALGLAGAAGTGVASASGAVEGIAAGTALDAAGGLALAPTAGLFGSGGAVSLAGGLGLASIGANLAQGAVSGDLAGPLGLAAGVAQRAEQQKYDQQQYGFQATPEDKAAITRAAIQSGADIAGMNRIAASGGPPVSAQLAQHLQQVGHVEQMNATAQRIGFMGDGQDLEYAIQNTPGGLPRVMQGQQIFQNTMQAELEGMKTAARLKAEQQNDLARGIVTMNPDLQKMRELQPQMDEILASADEFQQTQGASGRPLYERRDELDTLTKEYDTARRGKIGPPPELIPGATTNEGKPAKYGDPFIKLPGGREMYKTGVDAKGAPTYVTSPPTPQADLFVDPVDQIGKATANMPIGPQRDQFMKQATNEAKRFWGVRPGTEEDYILKRGGVEKREPTLEEKTSADVDAAIVKGLTGGTIGPQEATEIQNTYLRRADLPNFVGKLGESVQEIGSGTLTRDKVRELQLQAQFLFPPARDEKTGELTSRIPPDYDAMLDQLTLDATNNDIAKAQSQMVGPPVPPPAPPGSAESVEQEMRTSERLRAERKAFPAKRKQELAAAEKDMAERKVRSEGREREEQAAKYEEIAIRNIRGPKQSMSNLGRAARPVRDTVVALNQKTGATKEVLRSSVTPELQAQLKAEGWIIPGMEEGD